MIWKHAWRMFALLVLLGLVCRCGAQDSAPPDAKAPPPEPAGVLPGTLPATLPDAVPAAPLPSNAFSSSLGPFRVTQSGIETDQDPDRNVSWKRVWLNVAEDQKPIWMFPISVFRGHHLLPVLSVAALTAGLVTADPYDSGYFYHTRTFDGFDRVFNGHASAYGLWAAPLAFDFAGFLTGDHYAERTAVLAGEAVLDAEIVTTVMKDITLRWQPIQASTIGNGNYRDTWFRSANTNYLGGAGDFPSGHEIAAFAIATVFADRYGAKHKWVKYVAYGLAGTVGFSRVSLGSHFPSDVFLGAAIAYSISHYVVLQR